MNKGDILALLIGLGLIVVYFVRVLPRLGFVLTSPVVAAAYWLVIAVLITFPAAKFLSEKVVPNALARGKGKVKREYSKARSLAAQGRFEEAIEEYRRGLEEEPDNLTLRLDIAEIYGTEMRDYPQAIQELEECLKFQPGPVQGASILNRIADIYENNLANTMAARDALQRVQNMYPGTKQAFQAGERVAAMKESRPGLE